MTVGSQDIQAQSRGLPNPKANKTEAKQDDYQKFAEELNQSDIDPKGVTADVLRLCNVFRVKQNVHPGVNFMRKRTGTGGCGGRKLSPE